MDDRRAPGSGESPGFDDFGRILSFCMKAKAKMIEKGLRRAHAKCPLCEDGRVRFSLAGRRDHLHAACSTEGCLRMMQ